ncbi:MAG TPA: hypothetical protein VGD59_07575 [Acidisarcina sp.]
MRLAKLLTCLVLILPAAAAFAGPESGPKLFIAPDGGFETDIAAGIIRKHVPVILVTDEASADFTLTAIPVEIHSESTGSKVVRCLFAYCAGIQDSGKVSVQLVNAHSKAIVWAYNVAKQNGGRNNQSMAEAIAKHLNNDFLKKQE